VGFQQVQSSALLAAKKSPSSSLGTAIAAVLATSMTATVAVPAPAWAAAPVKPTNNITLSVGTGRMVRLNGAISDLFVADEKVADVQVRSANQIYIFGKGPGETTVFATDRAGRTVYSTNVRVGTNIGNIDELLNAAMPEAQIRALPINGTVLLTGTVAAPSDVEEATRIVQAFVGEGTQVISRLKTATPLQVMLQVKIAEVSRSLVREIGVNLLTRDNSGGFLFGLMRGRTAGTIKDITSPTLTDPFGNPLVVGTDYTFNAGSGTTLGAAGRLFGMDILSSLDLAENDNRVTTLAEPTLTALSGETASFLAGGEFPIPISQGLNGTSIEFKQFGVSLSFTPTVLEGGRISMRVRPEVSEISTAGSVSLNGFQVPSLTTRRAETTVELGSGQSFMIGGLMRNTGTNSTDKAPFLGNLPILGALFKSNSFKRNETELVIVVTPYLVRPVSAGQIALPTDGFRNSTTAQRLLINRQDVSRNAPRPGPTMAPPQTATPGIDGGATAPQPAVPGSRREQPAARQEQQPTAKPGFSF
jgi:pilus assembly protein CpaC